MSLNNILQNKLGVDYADALKEALILRRNNTITTAIDNQLGHLLYSVTQWSIAAAVKSGKLWRTFSQDEDFQSEILSAVVSYADKVDLSRAPKEILTYLYRVGRSAIRDQILKANTLKRQHEDVPLEGAVMECDFWGKPCGVAYEIEQDNSRRS